LKLKVKLKVCEVAPVHAIEIYMDGRGKAPLILNLGVGGECSTSSPYFWDKTLVYNGKNRGGGGLKNSLGGFR